jgi:SAM-dependent methyltransferase
MNQLDQFSKVYLGESIYSLDNEIMLKWFSKRIIEIAPRGACLELGLGYGYTTSLIAPHYTDFTVLEGSPEVITIFKDKHPNLDITIIETWFEKYEPNRQFDVILMGFILEHVNDPVAILKQFRPYLKPGGKLYASVPNSHALNRRFGHEAGYLKDYKELSEHDHQLGHLRFYDVDSFKADFTEAGYKVLRTEGMFLKAMSTKQIVDTKVPQEILDAMCKVGIDYPELCASLLVEAVAE